MCSVNKVIIFFYTLFYFYEQKVTMTKSEDQSCKQKHKLQIIISTNDTLIFIYNPEEYIHTKIRAIALATEMMDIREAV